MFESFSLTGSPSSSLWGKYIYLYPYLYLSSDSSLSQQKQKETELQTNHEKQIDKYKEDIKQLEQKLQDQQLQSTKQKVLTTISYE